MSARNLGSSHFVHSARKLRERYIGPFKILRRVARYAYELDVKDTLPREYGYTQCLFHECGVVMEIYTTRGGCSYGR